MKSLFTRHGVLRLLALSFALGALGIGGGALAAGTGGLRITITGPDGAPIQGATVQASSPNSLVSRSGVTAADGTVALRQLPPATNYTVTVEAAGYPDFSADDVAVVTGKQLSLGYSLGSAAKGLGTIVVTGRSLAAVDTTSATVGDTLTLDITESLPTGRDYQSYLQLVPAVKPSSTGNPSSRSGVNYSNIGGDIGYSTDNVYILDGINVTDPLTGGFGSNINSEIIQEQQVLTGGIPAKYAGGVGLVSKVVTKSGGNEFHGSINYYFQNDSLVADNKHGVSAGFSTYDTAFTLGGPIVKDSLWFFLSYQKKHRTESVVNPKTEEELRSVDTDSKLGFFKATWQITDNDRVQATFFNDPYERSGSLNENIPNNSDSAREQGGKNYRLSYAHDWSNFHIDLYAYQHKSELAVIPANLETSNDVAYLDANPTSEQTTRGGSGTTLDTWRNRKQFGLNGEYWLNTGFGTHDIEFGVTSTEVEYQETTSYSGPTQAHYTSVAAEDAGVTLGKYMESGANWTGTRDLTSADTDRIISEMMDSADKGYFLSVLDTSGDGTISADELEAYKLTSTAGNPNGQVNAYRIRLFKQNPYAVSSKGKTVYLQDSWTMGQWTVNAGVRAEQWKHFASTGEDIFTFDWKLAPRLSVVYDLFGDGTSKVWGFYGRYYDPIRNNMTDFAGALTGNVYHEQIFIGDRWFTFRTRGGAVQRDATFVPSTQTPYTDELMLGYETTLTENTTLKVVADYRDTRDILEDFAISLYSDYSNKGVPPEARPGAAAPGDKYFLPYEYYGYEGGFPKGINYYIGTLPGAERKYMGLTVTLTKYRADNWMGQVSYTYNHFEGNSNSDSNADFQGDWIALDPRSPNRWGQMPGNIKHMFKAYGAYYFDNGFELAGVFHWNSGYAYTKSFSAYGRHLPVMGPAYVDGGVYDTWILPGSVGAYTAPSYWTFDIRAKYNWDLPTGKLEFFLDIFNVFNNQAATSVMDLAGGNATYAFQEANGWVEPMRAYLGVRYSF
ncbi:TonB-dependent receptor [Dyella sp.]|uniref:TonB-dependent receptor n=1 Tax=Dyella sp. TaxID=1869338 RepID=UPI002D764F69|nr:TonB-dependent receptor [Dyella sp.]HET7332858.1 TonB-dependent receptor [Dyella sp.]HET7371183.1 TonB-dependent receptor [Gammaproteobacteria bacterium]